MITVLGKPYRVEVRDINTPSGEGPLGTVYNSKQLIYLHDGQGKETMADTLLHELLHALDFNMAIKLKERQVHALAAGLLALFRDNPELCDIMLGNKVLTEQHSETA